MPHKLFIVIHVDWALLMHRKDVALNALKNGYDVTIVTKDTGRKEELISLGFKFIDLPISRSGKNILAEYKLFRFLKKLYKKNKPDLVHHVGMKAVIWGTIAAKQAKIHGVLNAVSGLGTLFSNESNSLISSLLIKIMRYSHNRHNLKIIFQNNDDKSFFIENKIIDEARTLFIKGSGIDLDKFCYVEEPYKEKVRVIFTARMIREKGIYILVDAANKLKEKYYNTLEFILCGDLDDSRSAISKKELELISDGKYISWLGHRTDIKELLESSHIVAFPSYYKEGLPKALIEACAIGRPIVTTDTTGCRDVVTDQYNGYIIPIKDSQLLAEKLNILINDKVLRIEMGKNSRIIAEKYFSIGNVINEHLKIYSELSN